MRRVSPCFLAVLLALSALAVGLGAPASADPLSARQRGGSLLLETRADGARLTFPGGEAVELPLPEGAALTRLASLAGESWVAAGSAPVLGPLKNEGATDLLLLTGDGGGVRRLPAPPAREGHLRALPVVLEEDGRLVGLAWLEGSDSGSFGVRAAAWNGRAWSRPEVVAPPGPGSQLALTGQVLADGTWLLAWSAFDGADDEIVSARRRSGAWERPSRVAPDNDTPDVTPALLATADGGALLAWSRRVDLDYYLYLARLEKDSWTEARRIGGKGTLFPAFSALALPAASDAIDLLYVDAGDRLAVPAERREAQGDTASSWKVARLDAAGTVRETRRSTRAGLAGRPALLHGADGALTLRWSAPAGLALRGGAAGGGLTVSLERMGAGAEGSGQEVER